MNTQKIFNGLVPLKAGESAKERLEQMKKRQDEEKEAQKNAALQTRKDYERLLSLQQTHSKAPKPSRDHSSTHDASRRYAGSRRCG